MNKSTSPRWLFLLIPAAIFFASIEAVNAATITVTTTTDELADPGPDNGCSLREAIQSINNAGDYGGCAGTSYGTNDTINLPAGTYTTALAGSGEDSNATGDYDLLKDVSIAGAGAASTIINGGAIDRVFDIKGMVTIAISSLTIQNGSTSGAFGGGILNSGMLNITNSTISGNTSNSGAGGGIFIAAGTAVVTNSTIIGNTTNGGHAGGIFIASSAALTVTNSTFSGNSSTAAGGGIFNSVGNLTVTNSTFSGNTAAGGWGGGGIYSSGTANITNSTISRSSSSIAGGGIWYSGTLNLKNTIVANQTNHGDCNKSVSNTLNDLDSDGSCGVTLSGKNPLLGTLASNGGPTQTMALPISSPAIDAGDNATCSASPVKGVDQRGVTRPQGSVCDIGAYEKVVATSVPTLPEWGVYILLILLTLVTALTLRQRRL